MWPGYLFVILYCSTEAASENYDIRDCGIKDDPSLLQEKTANSEFPWHVTLYRQYLTTDPAVYLCGGSIIHPKIIITAAHCVYNESTSEVGIGTYTVAAGKLNKSWEHLDSTEQRFKVIEIELPPEYSGFNNRFADDMALLTLNDSIKFNSWIKPVCVDWKLEFNVHDTMKQGTIVRWSVTENSSLTEKLQSENLQYFNFTSCRNEVSEGFSNFISSDKFCAHLNNDADVEKGDSGGGYVFSRNTSRSQEQYFIYGILSIKDSKTKGLAIFTDIGLHINWLTTNVKSIIDGRRKTCGKLYQFNSTNSFGMPSRHTVYPWYVLIYAIENPDTIKPVCSGSIIHSKALITGSRCLNEYSDGKNNLTYTVAIKSYTNNETEEPLEKHFKVEKIHNNEYFVGSAKTHENDIAILELEEELRFNDSVLPVCIDWDDKLNLLSNPTAVGTVVTRHWRCKKSKKSCLEPTVGKYRKYGLPECRKAHAESSNKLKPITYDKLCGERVGGAFIIGGAGGSFTFPKPCPDPDNGDHFLYGVISYHINTSLLSFTNIALHLNWIRDVLNSIV